MAYVAQMLTQEPIYKPSSIFCFKPILLSAHKLILLIYGDNRMMCLYNSLTAHQLDWVIFLFMFIFLNKYFDCYSPRRNVS